MHEKVNLIEPHHEQEFQTFRRMGAVHAMVYLSGYMNDLYQMIEAEREKDGILSHLRDAREMLSILAKDWAREKGYRIEGSMIIDDRRQRGPNYR